MMMTPISTEALTAAGKLTFRSLVPAYYETTFLRTSPLHRTRLGPLQAASVPSVISGIQTYT